MHDGVGPSFPSGPGADINLAEGLEPDAGLLDHYSSAVTSAVARVARTDLRPGDLLLTADGEELAGVDVLQRLLTAAAIDRSIELRFLRGREILSRTVKPALRP